MNRRKGSIYFKRNSFVNSGVKQSFHHFKIRITLPLEGLMNFKIVYRVKHLEPCLKQTFFDL